MAVMRINKTKDYTIMSNRHFKEKEMSLKAKGLLSLMLSLPESWDYSIAGLVAICKENETAIKSTLNELKKFGYLRVTKLLPNETTSGRIEYVYDIFETPLDAVKQVLGEQATEKQGVENLGVEFLPVENQGQLITKESNTKESNTKVLNTKNKPKKQKYGEYARVSLTDREYERLIKDYGQEETAVMIKKLDEYIETSGKRYKNHNLVLRGWVLDWYEKEYFKTPEILKPKSEAPKAQEQDPELTKRIERLKNKLGVNA